ncbi:MAG: hypothetical protein M1831_007197 [Alyxoria varia]|nr:MAG: hypothetical protein M1831_007197 [Alyxoria varia]
MLCLRRGLGTSSRPHVNRKPAAADSLYRANDTDVHLRRDETPSKGSTLPAVEEAGALAPKVEENSQQLSKRGFFSRDSQENFYFAETKHLSMNYGVRFDIFCASQFVDAARHWLSLVLETKFPYKRDYSEVERCYKTNPQTGQREVAQTFIMVWKYKGRKYPWQSVWPKKGMRPYNTPTIMQSQEKLAVGDRYTKPLAEFVADGIYGVKDEFGQVQQIRGSVIEHKTKPFLFQYRILNRGQAEEEDEKLNELWKKRGVVNGEVKRLAEQYEEELEIAADNAYGLRTLNEVDKGTGKRKKDLLADWILPHRMTSLETPYNEDDQLMDPRPQQPPPTDEEMLDMLKPRLFQQFSQIKQSLSKDATHEQVEKQVNEVMYNHRVETKGSIPKVVPQQSVEGGQGGGSMFSTNADMVGLQMTQQRSRYWKGEPFVQLEEEENEASGRPEGEEEPGTSQQVQGEQQGTSQQVEEQRAQDEEDRPTEFTTSLAPNFGLLRQKKGQNRGPVLPFAAQQQTAKHPQEQKDEAS